MTSTPLVSCIMPTYNRRRFVSQSIRYFLRQDYPARELIIVDDGSDAVVDLIPKDERIRYVRLDKRYSVGLKRNLACEVSRGELIAHWDDDDWYAPNRLSSQVNQLESSKADVCFVKNQFFYDLVTGACWRCRYLANRRPWLAGSTLLYRRSAWAAHPFADRNVGEDTAFVWQFAPDRLHAIADSSFAVGIIHQRNTAAKSLRGPRWQRHRLSEVIQLLAAERDFYLALRNRTSYAAKVNARPAIISQRKVLRDCLKRAEIILPATIPRAKRCIATIVSPGFERWLDDMLGSLYTNGGCQDALVVVFTVGESRACKQVIAKYKATAIRCRPHAHINATVKSVLYSVARVVDAQQFICLDADMLVLGNLRPVFTALEACPEGSILVCREGNKRGFTNLQRILCRDYRGKESDLERLLPNNEAKNKQPKEGAYSLVVNDGLFAGSRTALLALDGVIRTMPQAAAWTDERADVWWRNQFVFNLALARLQCGVELDAAYNLQLHVNEVQWSDANGDLQATWQGRPMRVLHFSGKGKYKYKKWRDRFSAPLRQVGRTSSNVH